MRIPADRQLDHLDVHQILALADLDSASVAAAEIRLSEMAREIPDPLVLHMRDGAGKVQMRLRWIGPEYRVASLTGATPRHMETSPERPSEVSDWLTGLASRQSFQNAIDDALARRPEEPLAVLLLDLDRFKAVNDTLGHAAGDAVLRLAAQRLASAVRQSDLVARLQGDEFAILIYPALTRDEPTTIAHRILEIVQRTYLIEGQLVNVGASLGIALAPSHGTTRESLMKNADLALYHSKTSGRATFHFFDLKMEALAQARRTSELELRRALALRQIEVFYQPQVDIKTGRLIGFEALVRWRHPVHGLIPPSDFLPLAEQIGVIIPLGDWVLRTACRQAMEWPDHIVIAVNASPIQFETGRFAESVRRALSSTGLPGARLEIEITEGVLLRKEDTVLETLHALREMQVRIAMDDFGTGYASLSQLAQFPFDKIKIDRSLTGFAGNNPKHRAIVRAIAILGESLGVSTMAEGVETGEQLERLQHDGCSSVQGYLFSRPVPASELATIIAELSSSDKIERT